MFNMVNCVFHIWLDFPTTEKPSPDCPRCVASFCLSSLCRFSSASLALLAKISSLRCCMMGDQRCLPIVVRQSGIGQTEDLREVVFGSVRRRIGQRSVLHTAVKCEL